MQRTGVLLATTGLALALGLSPTSARLQPFIYYARPVHPPRGAVQPRSVLQQWNISFHNKLHTKCTSNVLFRRDFTLQVCLGLCRPEQHVH